MLGDRHVKQRDRNRSLLIAKKSSHEICRDRTTGQSVAGDNAQATTVGGIGRQASHRNAGATGAPYPWSKGLGMAGKGNDPIHSVADGSLKNFFFPLSEMRVGARLDLDIL